MVGSHYSSQTQYFHWRQLTRCFLFGVFFCFWCSWAFPRTRQLRLDFFFFFSETRSGLSHMVPFYYRMQQQQRGHCHSHKVITQTGNRLIAHTKMHSTFNHLLVGFFFFFSTLTFLFFFFFYSYLDGEIICLLPLYQTTDQKTLQE